MSNNVCVVDLALGSEIKRFFGSEFEDVIKWASDNCCGEWIILPCKKYCLCCNEIINHDGVLCRNCLIGDYLGYWIVYRESSDSYEIFVRRESERDAIERDQDLFCVEWYFEALDAHRALGW
jgi:hypothetical protein